MPSIVCLGEALVDFVADVPDVSLIDCPGFRKAAGGAVANVAVGLARLGVKVAFVGKVGEDAFGHFLEQTFAGAGVDTGDMVFDTEARTGLAFVSLQADGERDFVFFRNPSADMRLRADEVPDTALEDRAFYHFGSLTLPQEPSRSATYDSLRRARERGARISYDPNLRPALWPDLDTARREMLTALPQADVLKISEEEAEFLYGPASLREHASCIRDAGVTLVAITRGPHGAYLSTTAGDVEVPGFRVNAIDATGAGDGFMAGLLSSLLERRDLSLSAAELAEIGRFANAVGALTCTRKGAIPALPTRDQVEALLSAV
jgi:fructokinase